MSEALKEDNSGQYILKLLFASPCITITGLVSIMQKNVIHFIRHLAAIWLGLFIVMLPAQNILAAPAMVNGLPDLTKLVEKTAPAVVLIVMAANVEKEQKPESFGDFVNRIFGGEKKEKQRAIPEEIEKRKMGTGSGFLVSPDGYILTNQHVVDGMDALLIKMRNGQVFEAKVLGADQLSDVALLKIDSSSNFPYLKMGRSADVKAGQWVVAIGSPRGLEDSVSFGIVSNTSRDISLYYPSIQMDAAVNPGNSGGPAINMAGEVIGINSAIEPSAHHFAGISYAIPIDGALKVANDLGKYGKVKRGIIGIDIAKVDGKLAKHVGLSYTHGLQVVGVAKGSSAEKAGIKAKDILLRFNNRVLHYPLELVRLVGDSTAGTKAHFLVWREGREIDVPVMIATNIESK